MLIWVRSVLWDIVLTNMLAEWFWVFYKHLTCKRKFRASKSKSSYDTKIVSHTTGSFWNFGIDIVLLLWRWKIKYRLPSKITRFKEIKNLEDEKNLTVTINFYKNIVLHLSHGIKSIYRSKLYQQHTRGEKVFGVATPECLSVVSFPIE